MTDKWNVLLDAQSQNVTTTNCMRRFCPRAVTHPSFYVIAAGRALRGKSYRIAARISACRVPSRLQTRLQRLWQRHMVQVGFVLLSSLVSTLFVSEIGMRPKVSATVIPDMEKQGRMCSVIAWP